MARFKVVLRGPILVLVCIGWICSIVQLVLWLASCGDVAVRARVRVVYPGGECTAACEIESARCTCDDPCAGLEGDALRACIGAPAQEGSQQ